MAPTLTPAPMPPFALADRPPCDAEPDWLGDGVGVALDEDAGEAELWTVGAVEADVGADIISDLVVLGVAVDIIEVVELAVSD